MLPPVGFGFGQLITRSLRPTDHTVSKASTQSLTCMSYKHVPCLLSSKTPLSISELVKPAAQRCSLHQKIPKSALHQHLHTATNNERSAGHATTYPPYAHALAGAGGGLATVLLLHPLDTLRTRLQVSTGDAALRTLRNIVVREGSNALYKGVVPASIGSVASWACYFHWFQQTQVFYKKHIPFETAAHLMAGMTAGAMTSLATNPIWVVKVRLQLQAVNSGVQPGIRPYTGLTDGLRSILREEGVRGLYKGLGPSLWLVSHGAIQFTLYERIKAWVKTRENGDARQASSDSTTVYQSLVASTTSKLIASISTYPIQVARTRMQERIVEGEMYGRVDRAFLYIFRTEGIRGLYRGLSANIARVTPQAAVTFITYEQILRLCASRSG